MSTQHPSEWSTVPGDWPSAAPAGVTVPAVTIPAGDPPSSCTCPVNGWWGTVPPPPCPVHGPFTPTWPVAPTYPTWPGDEPAAPGWDYSTTLSSLPKPAPAISDADVERIAKRVAEALRAPIDAGIEDVKAGRVRHMTESEWSLNPLDWPNAAAPRSYKCKHTVEAMRWLDTDEDREALAAWFDVHDQMFETRGSVIVLQDECGEVQEGEWVLWSDGEFLVMDDDSFTSNYEAA